jgi:Holliday junction resolvase-like predicted endonuclease
VGGRLTSGSIGRLGEQAAFEYLKRSGYTIIDRQVKMFGKKRVYDMVTKKGGETVYWEVKANGGRLSANQAYYDRLARREGVTIRYIQVGVDSVTGAIRSLYL